MMNSADPSPPTDSQRPADAPTLWLSLALGSVLIHLVLFVMASIVSMQTAKVQLDMEPIAVEFVEPPSTNARSSAPTIAARPGRPSSTRPSSTQAQPNISPRSSSLNQPIEQPFVPLPPVKRKLTPSRPRPPQPSVPRSQPQPSNRSQPQPIAPSNSVPPQPDPNQRSQPEPSSDPAQPGNGAQPGASGASTGNGAPPGSEPPVRSGVAIAEPPKEGNVSVDVPEVQETNDLHRQKASIQSPIAVSINYPALITPDLQQGITVRVRLEIDQFGFVSRVISTQLLSVERAIEQATLDDLANQVFMRSNLKFNPAQDGSDVSHLKPQRSDPTITARIQLH